MCASYGLGGGQRGEGESFGLEPMDQRENKLLLNEWISARNGRAAITGRKEINLNPIIFERGGERSLELAWWSIPRPGGDGGAFNSRDDTLLRYWRKPFQQRALLPATWYVEKGKRFTLPGGELFAIASILSTVTDNSGAEHIAYSMVTRDAIGEARGAHPRMPLTLPAEMHAEWLSGGRAGDASLVAEAQHASVALSEAMTAEQPETLF